MTKIPSFFKILKISFKTSSAFGKSWMTSRTRTTSNDSVQSDGSFDASCSSYDRFDKFGSMDPRIALSMAF